MGAFLFARKDDWYSNEMTRKEWEEIMGVHRDTYKLVNGAVKKEKGVAFSFSLSK